MILHEDTLPFLQELTVNNNRPWFNDHKDRWIAIKEQFEVFTQALIDEMVKYDDTLVGLTAKNSVYRIYRDTRFSPDKTPYKTHIACFLSSWGPKNSGVPGYYFQLGTEEAYGLKGTCNLGGGIFMPTPDALNAIRQEIFYCTSYTMPEKLLASEKLFDEVLKVWRASVPLNRFVQRAMEDVKK